MHTYAGSLPVSNCVIVVYNENKKYYIENYRLLGIFCSTRHGQLSIIFVRTYFSAWMTIHSAHSLTAAGVNHYVPDDVRHDINSWWFFLGPLWIVDTPPPSPCMRNKKNIYQLVYAFTRSIYLCWIIMNLMQYSILQEGNKKWYIL